MEEDQKIRKRDIDNLEAKLLGLRREIYICYKLIGDLVQTGFASANIALDILNHIISDH